AAKSFAAAYQHDTTFALAALRIFSVNGWLPFAGAIPGDWSANAWKNRARLHGSDSLLLVASTGSTYPAPTPARQNEREAWHLPAQGNTAELWYRAGDVLPHRYMLSGDT